MSTFRLTQAVWMAIPVIALAVASLPPKVDAKDLNQTQITAVLTTSIAVP